MPPNDAEQVRKEKKQVTDLCDAMERAASEGRKLIRMQKELLVKLGGSDTTPDYSDSKYDNNKKRLDAAYEECGHLLSDYLPK